jgi:hypothetical protein
MKTITQHIRDRLLVEVNKLPPVELPAMLKSQWSNTFVRYMRNRMAMGGYRYGQLDDPGQPQYDNIGSLIMRAELYQITGNQEHLVDIANLALVEFVRGCCHPDPHWSPEDDGYHTKELK